MKTNLGESVIKLRAWVALFLVFVVTAAAPVLLAPRAYAADEATVQTWFDQKAMPLIASHASDVFKDYSNEQMGEFKLAKPVPVAIVTNPSQAERAELEVRDEWAAAIQDAAGSPVGAVSVHFSENEVREELALADVSLGQYLLDAASGTIEGLQVVRDPELQAWFVIQDGLISAADSVGKDSLMGAISVEDFLIQRDRNTGHEPTYTEPEPQVREEPQAGIQPVQIAVIAIVILALLTLTIMWLKFEERRSRADQWIVPELPAKTGDLTVVDAKEGQTKAKLSKAAGRVTLYRREQDDSENVK